MNEPFAAGHLFAESAGDAMSFEPENEFERSLVKAATDPAHRPQFYRDLADAEIFVIQHGVQPSLQRPPATLPTGTSIQLQPIEYGGHTCLPFFSSLTRLRAVLEAEASYLQMNARNFLELTAGSALLLNPGAEYGKEITAAEAASMVNGSIWQPQDRRVTTSPTQILIGQPKRYPTELTDVLRRFFKTKRKVTRAWVAHYHNPASGDDPHTLLGIAATGDFAALSAETGIVVNGVKIPDPPVDIMAITGAGGVQDYFQRTKPFYQRRFLGLF